MEYIIGIDLGTGSTKAIAMNHAGDVVDTEQVAYPILQPQPGYQEQPPETIWQAFLRCIAGIASRHSTSPQAICLSSAMHSVIPVDDHGEALMNMMIWADNRSADIARAILHSPEGKRIYEKSGTPIHAMTPLCKLRWLEQNEPDTFKKTARFISIKEYVWFKLFGEYEADYSIASATGLMDIGELKWNHESLDVAGVRSSQLSRLVNTNHRRHCTDASLCTAMGISKDTVFVIGASDGCLANIGSFATDERSLALTIGTSGAVRVTQNRPILNFKAMTFNYLLDHNTYVCGGPINNGGIALKWYAENLLGKKLESSHDYTAMLQTLNDTRPGAEGLIFLPYIHGERAPVWNSDACGVFFGMRAHHNQSHFTRAVVEGISAALYDITTTMIDNGMNIEQVNVSGGFVQSAHWLQIIADLFGIKVCLVNTTDASATGAAFLAMKELGIIARYDQLKPGQFIEYFPGAENTNAYQAFFRNYKRVYESVHPLMS